MPVNSAVWDLRFELYNTQSFQYPGPLKMVESTISESAESEIRKKKIKAADPLAGQAEVFFDSSRNPPPPSGTRDEPVNRSAWEAGPSGSPSGVSAVTKSAVLAICTTARGV